MTLSTDSRDRADNWGAAEWRQPNLEPGDVLLFHECGRVMRETDHRSHSFKIVVNKFGRYAFLLVRHGGGDERFPLHYRADEVCTIFAPLSSDDRYSLMRVIHDLRRKTIEETRCDTAYEFQRAFVEGRLKKRKERGRAAYKVTMEPRRNATGMFETMENHT